jgi:hypothetical protein
LFFRYSNKVTPHSFLACFLKKINVKEWHSPYNLSACKQWHDSPHEEKP